MSDLERAIDDFGAKALDVAAERNEFRSELNFLRVRCEQLEDAARKLVWAARTSGGVAGRDEGLCQACEAVEALLEYLPDAPNGPLPAPPLPSEQVRET